MTGIYLKCEACGATLGGEQVTANPNMRGVDWGNAPVLVDAARKLGWTGSMTSQSNDDRCPACSRATPSAGAATPAREG